MDKKFSGQCRHPGRTRRLITGFSIFGEPVALALGRFGVLVQKVANTLRFEHFWARYVSADPRTIVVPSFTKSRSKHVIWDIALACASDLGRDGKILEFGTNNGGLRDTVIRVLGEGGIPVVLGGDHSVAIGTVSGIAGHLRTRKKRLGVLWIHAHGDFNTPASSPSGNIHGMPLAVCAGLGPEQLLAVGGKFRKVDPRNIAIIGLRDLDAQERRNLVRYGVNLYTMEEIDRHGMHRVMGKALRDLIRRVDELHVSFDLDSIDPAYAPGVGTPVKGGLDYREAHLAMEMVAELR